MKFFKHPGVEGIHSIRPVEPEDQDTIFDFGQKGIIRFHGPKIVNSRQPDAN